NLNAGYWDVFWPQFIQGLALALLFVPLTTVTMDPIQREEMGNATSIFNLMRNLGGSMGIAAATTLLARQQQLHINRLGANVTIYSPQARVAIDQMRNLFMGQGSDPTTATNRAYGLIFGQVQQQASMLSFMDVFHILGVIFLLVVPALLIMRRPRHRGPVAMHCTSRPDVTRLRHSSRNAEARQHPAHQHDIAGENQKRPKVRHFLFSRTLRGPCAAGRNPWDSCRRSSRLRRPLRVRSRQWNAVRALPPGRVLSPWPGPA